MALSLVEAGGRAVIQALTRGAEITRYELTDDEWTAIKLRVPRKEIAKKAAKARWADQAACPRRASYALR